MRGSYIFRLDDDLKTALEAAASEQGLTMSELLNRILSGHFYTYPTCGKYADFWLNFRQQRYDE